MSISRVLPHSFPGPTAEHEIFQKSLQRNEARPHIAIGDFMHNRLSVLLFAGCLLPCGASAEDMPAIPAALAVKKGVVVTTVSARGAQIYECARMPKGQFAWSFRAPKAELVKDGKTIGQHFAGPTWEFSDGTRVVARVAANAPAKDAGDIAWLKLDVTQKAKKGPAAGAKYVLRIDTKGGTLSGSCTTDKETREVPYQATYVFVK